MQALTRTAIRPARRVLARAAPGVAPPQQFAMVTRNVSKGPSAMGGIYNLAMSSTSRYVTAVVAAAAVFELAFGFVTDTFWESHNKGVSALPPKTCLCQILGLTPCSALFHRVYRNCSTMWTGASLRAAMTMTRMRMTMMTNKC